MGLNILTVLTCHELYVDSSICDPDSSGPVLLCERPAVDLPPAAVSRSVPHAACDWRGPSTSRTAGCQWDLTAKSFSLIYLSKNPFRCCLSISDIKCTSYTFLDRFLWLLLKAYSARFVSCCLWRNATQRWKEVDCLKLWVGKIVGIWQKWDSDYLVWFCKSFL